MDRDDIQVGGVYGAWNKAQTKPLPMRLVVAFWTDERGSWVTYTPYPRVWVHVNDRGVHKSTLVYKTISLRAFARWAQYCDKVEDNDRLRFIDNCRVVVDRLGQDAMQPGDRVPHRVPSMAQMSGPLTDARKARFYEDDDIAISVSTCDGTMLIRRKENNNPVVYLDPNGVSYRSHGEQRHLFDHVDLLLMGVPA